MTNTIYANKINKKDIPADGKIYWFTNFKNQLVGIISFGELNLNDTVALYTATSHRFVSFLDRTNINNSYIKGTVYYICD